MFTYYGNLLIMLMFLFTNNLLCDPVKCCEIFFISFVYEKVTNAKKIPWVTHAASALITNSLQKATVIDFYLVELKFPMRTLLTKCFKL